MICADITKRTMKIEGKVHCLFEQSGTFKNEFKKLGYEAYDYDIQNHFGETDFVIDLFSEINKAYEGGASIFDTFTKDDLLLAFFPCIYFCDINEPLFSLDDHNYLQLPLKEKYERIIARAEERQKFYELCLRMFCVVDTRGLRMVMENPYSKSHYLVKNFVYKAKVIDRNRRMRGDYFVKPTQYFYVNCDPTFGQTYTMPKETKNVCALKGREKGGLCNEERSMISPDYARNFICDFILGKKQKHTQLTLFDNEL